MNVTSLAARIAALARAGLIAGIVVAALAYPFAALAGWGVKTGMASFEGSLEQLTIVPPAQTSHLYAADGTTLITQFYEEYRSYTPVSEMSPHIQHAIVAAEDARFYEHHGVDLKGIVRAFVANQQAGQVSQGASTLTMQYVRNVLRDSARTPAEVEAATEQTGTRKLREMRLAMELEKRLTKTEILERYLNVAYFGHRAYGIFAAAEVYFSKRPADLTLAEAATLAGLVQAPSTYDPAGEHPSDAIARRNYVVDRMVSLGYASVEEAAQARAEPIRLKLTEPANDCASVPAAHSDWGFFCDMFKSWWMRQPAFGSSGPERLERLRRGGYRIVTPFDPGVQASAMIHILAKEKATSSHALGMVAIEPGTGHVRAMAVNRVYSINQSRNGPHSDPALRRKVRGNYPNTVNPLLGGGDLPGYQAGSTFKMFTMLAALEQGMTLSTSFYAPPKYTSIYLSGPDDPKRCGIRWCPENASNSMTGRQTIWSGFGKSVNTFWVQVEQKVGAQNAVRMAERLGLTWHTDIDRLQASPAKARTWGAFTLGVADTTPLEMASAYATVAADGVYCEPLPVLSIVGLDGSPVPAVANPRCHQAVSTAVARGAIDAARCVTGYGAATGDCGGWSTGPSAYRTVGRPLAGKTGTTDDNRSAWFIGMTPGLTVAGFIADPDYPFHTVSKSDHDKPIKSVTETMRDALVGTPIRRFTAPPSEIVGGRSRKRPARAP